MKNSRCSFLRFMDIVAKDLDKTRVYVDDLMVYSKDWTERVKVTRAVFGKLRLRSRYTVKYLGHVVVGNRSQPAGVRQQDEK